MTDRRRLSPRGFSLVEIAVAVGLSVVVLCVLYQFWLTSTRYSVDLEARITVLRKAQLAFLGISRDITGARRLVYPAAGGRERQGVAFIDRAGRPVMVALEPGPAAPADPRAPGRIYRYDWLSGERKTLLDGVLDLQCRVPKVPTGRAPDVVHMTVTLSGPRSMPVYLVASARLVPLDVVCPVNR